MDKLDPGPVFAAIAGSIGWRDALILVLIAMAATPLMLARPSTAAAVATMVLAATGLLHFGLSVEIAAFVVLSGLVFLIATLLVLDRRRTRQLEEDCKSLAERLRAFELAEARLLKLSAGSPLLPAARHAAHRLTLLNGTSGAKPANGRHGQARARKLSAFKS